MGMGQPMVSVDVVVVTESFSSLRNRTVNASVGHPPGIVYPSSCLIIMVMMDNYYALGSPVPLCPPS